MEESISAYEGKSFNVTLQSYLGSTNYGWCLISLPKGIILAGQANEPAFQDGTRNALVNQIFYFIATEATQEKTEIDFGLCCLTQNPSELNPFKYEEMVTVFVNVIPANKLEGSKFVQYSGNAAMYSPGGGSDLITALKYGYPCNLESGVGLKYGYPCSVDAAAYKYGYPCSQDAAAYKYGYPCAQENAVADKYGYPCSQDTTLLKYGYPCAQNDAALLKYGYPCSQDTTPVVKYGYPNC
ncbi:MAG: hypothetical protein PHH81_02675 [Bacteroides graminisolvens]|nr:hypothetical protein [Bacteroides graminisolvens]